jgi:hypothetical protein
VSSSTPPTSSRAPSDAPARLDLVAEELRDLARAEMAAAGDPSEPFGVYTFPSDAPGARLARSVEHEVFEKVFGNTPELLEAEYRHYDDATVFICALDHRRAVPAGMMRVILPSRAGLKTIDDLRHFTSASVDDVVAEAGIDLKAHETWDITTFAVADEYRRSSGGLVSVALYQCLGTSLRRFDVDWIVAVMDLVALDLVQQFTHGVFSRFPGTEPVRYLDSPASLPVYGDMGPYWPRLAVEDPDTFGIIGEGTGLEGTVRRPTDDDVDVAFAPARALQR